MGRSLSSAGEDPMNHAVTNGKIYGKRETEEGNEKVFIIAFCNGIERLSR